jgi:SAM-dependent methyltransferase
LAVTTPAFDSLASLYDLFQNWESRLPREIEILDRILSKAKARTILDAACGTGTHIASLAELGYDVAGTDISHEMVERASQRTGPCYVADFETAHDLVSGRDAVIVVGNSLPNAGGKKKVRRAIKGLGKCLAPGGVLILHVLNYPKLIAAGGGLGPVRRVLRDGREHLFVKLFEVHPEKVVLDVIALIRDGEGYERRLMRSDLHPVTLDGLTADLAKAGMVVTEARAGFSDDPYDEEESGDLLLVARKTGDRE